MDSFQLQTSLFCFFLLLCFTCCLCVSRTCLLCKTETVLMGDKFEAVFLVALWEVAQTRLRCASHARWLNTWSCCGMCMLCVVPVGSTCTHSMLQKGAEGKEQFLSHSVLSLSFQIALGKWSAVCLLIHLLSGKDPSLLRCERNHPERCKTIAWLFRAQGWEACIIRPRPLWSSSSQSFKNPYKATSCIASVSGILPPSASTLVKWNYVLLLHVT